MGNWIFGRNGKATLLFDSDCIRKNKGQVIAWISGVNLYALNGKHIGWFENGVLYDSQNEVLAFTNDASEYLPSFLGISGTPGIPGFAGKPRRPGFSGVPGRPGIDGWSQNNLETYFKSNLIRRKKWDFKNGATILKVHGQTLII